MVVQCNMQFAVGSANNVRWVKDRRLIFRKYLFSWFLVDFVSILPFNIIALVLKGSGDNTGASLSQQVRYRRRSAAGGGGSVAMVGLCPPLPHPFDV